MNGPFYQIFFGQMGNLDTWGIRTNETWENSVLDKWGFWTICIWGMSI